MPPQQQQQQHHPPPTIFRWLLDVSDLWPAPPPHPCPSSEGGSEPSSSSPSPFRSTPHWSTGAPARHALSLLPPPEQAKVLKFYRHTDAKLALASCLLKRRCVASKLAVPWAEVVIGAEEGGKAGKPCYVAPPPRPPPPPLNNVGDGDGAGGTTTTRRRRKRKGGGGRPIEFNVSHHGSLVVLVGCCVAGNAGDDEDDDDEEGEGEQGGEEAAKLGVDVVRVCWERDRDRVREEGFAAWANTYEMVFSEREVRDIAEYSPPPRVQQQQQQQQQQEEEEGDGEEEEDTIIRAKLRHFYAHWCMKEAYVKMTGEALLADWLKVLEFRHVRVPAPAVDGEGWGESCGDAEIWFHGERVRDVRLEIQAYGGDYMVATCSSNLRAELGAWHVCHLEDDIYPETCNSQSVHTS